MKMEDYATEERKAFLARQAKHIEKVERAKQQLGPKYLCHPANRVQKRVVPHDSHDVTGVFL